MVMVVHLQTWYVMLVRDLFKSFVEPFAVANERELGVDQ
jgi:hypothetical protein